MHENDYLNHLNKILWFLFSATALFGATISSILFAFAVLSTIFTQKFSEDYKVKNAFICILPYALCALSLFHGLGENALKHLSVKIPIIIIPIVFTFYSPKTIWIPIAYGLLSGILLASLSCFGMMLIRLYDTGFSLPILFSWGNTYSNYSPFIHPSYFSFFILLSLVVVWYDLTKVSMGVKLCLTIFLFITMLFLLSRIFIFWGVILFLIVLFKKTNNKIQIASLSFLVIISCLFIFKGNFIKDRFSNISKDLQLKGQNPKNAGRIERWSCPVNIILKNPLGIGVYNTKTALSACYKESGMTTASMKKYNTHNEFLNYGLFFGYIGVAGLLFTLIFMSYRFYQFGDYGFLFLAIALFTFMCFENVLSRYLGVIGMSMLILRLFLNIHKSKQV